MDSIPIPSIPFQFHQFHKRGIRSRIVKSVDGISEILEKLEAFSEKKRWFRRKIARFRPVFTFFWPFL